MKLNYPKVNTNSNQKVFVSFLFKTNATGSTMEAELALKQIPIHSL